MATSTKTVNPRIKAIWLRGVGRDMVVSIELYDQPGKWFDVIREYVATPEGEVHATSHIVEPAGIAEAIAEPSRGD